MVVLRQENESVRHQLLDFQDPTSFRSEPPKKFPTSSPFPTSQYIPVTAHQSIPLPTPQHVPVSTPQYIPVTAHQSIPLPTPQYVPVSTLQHVPVSTPQYAPVSEPISSYTPMPSSTIIPPFPFATQTQSTETSVNLGSSPITFPIKNVYSNTSQVEIQSNPSIPGTGNGDTQSKEEDELVSY